MPGPKPKGDRALTAAERAAAYRARKAAAADKPTVRYRRPQDRRSAPQRWADATSTLLDVLDGYQTWRDNLPPGAADSRTAEILDAVLELRSFVEELATAELPRGFGRD